MGNVVIVLYQCLTGYLGLCVSDLHDWSDPAQKCRTQTVSAKDVTVDKQSGALVNANQAKVALFRYNEKVYAINEKCPHAGIILYYYLLTQMSPF